MSYKVCIPTAGLGTRLEKLTKHINKSLVSVDNRPSISHIIDLFPETCEFVVALGYKGDYVKQFLELTYQKRKFYFHEVSPYEGKGSGLGLSILGCKKFLQEPFVFISCDTIVKGLIPPPSNNWIAYSKIDKTSEYRSVILDKDIVKDFQEKGHKTVVDAFPYIGLCGLKDYQIFWEQMLQGKDSAIQMGEVYGLKGLIDKKIYGYQLEWHDVGNMASLNKTRATFKKKNSPIILEKEEEAIWFVRNEVIKFSINKGFIKNRINRSIELKEYVPKIVNHSQNMYKYKKAKGHIISNIITLPLFSKLLDYSKKFWERKHLNPKQIELFKGNCKLFYKDKTYKRVNEFFNLLNKKDSNERINGEEVNTLMSTLDSIDWDWISSGIAGRFHGDFHFENILWNENEKKFTFLDWRQDFGGDLTNGDIYYDLAKLMHGLIVNHKIIDKNLFSVEWNKNDIKYELHRLQTLVKCEEYYNNWLTTNGYDFKKVRILTALIFLNIAVLHHNPYNLMLFSLGKQMLKEELSKK